MTGGNCGFFVKKIRQKRVLTFPYTGRIILGLYVYCTNDEMSKSNTEHIDNASGYGGLHGRKETVLNRGSE